MTTLMLKGVIEEEEKFGKFFFFNFTFPSFG